MTVRYRKSLWWVNGASSVACLGSMWLFTDTVSRLILCAAGLFNAFIAYKSITVGE